MKSLDTYLLMILAALFFGLLGVLVRYVTAYRGLALPTVVLVRGLTQTTLTLVTMRLLPEGQELLPKTQKHWRALALRGVSSARHNGTVRFVQTARIQYRRLHLQHHLVLHNHIT